MIGRLKLLFNYNVIFEFNEMISFRLNHVLVVFFSNAIAAESALDRLACALGGKTMLPHILSNVPQMLQNGQYSQLCYVKGA